MKPERASRDGGRAVRTLDNERQKAVRKERKAILIWLATFAIMAVMVILLFGTIAHPR
jgi:predicted nucleic acid-binding Zn ribbon protein